MMDLYKRGQFLGFSESVFPSQSTSYRGSIVPVVPDEHTLFKVPDASASSTTSSVEADSLLDSASGFAVSSADSRTWLVCGHFSSPRGASWGGILHPSPDVNNTNESSASCTQSRKEQEIARTQTTSALNEINDQSKRKRGASMRERIGGKKEKGKHELRSTETQIQARVKSIRNPGLNLSVMNLAAVHEFHEVY